MIGRGGQIAPRAFLLFEAMVTVAIATTVFLVILRSYGASKQAIASSARHLRASLLLEAKLFDACVAGHSERGSSSGTFPGSRYAWSSRASAFPDTELNEVSVSVYREDDREATEETVVTLVKNKAI